MAKTKPELARAMAWLYVNGPDGLRGDWAACSKAAGYVRPPRETNQQIHEFIKEFSSQTSMVADLLAEAGSASWETLAERARPILAKIATGKAFASTQQFAALKEIIQRGEGRIGTKTQDAEAVGVVVLPALGEGSGMRVCPKCLAALETPDDEANSVEA